MPWPESLGSACLGDKRPFKHVTSQEQPSLFLEGGTGERIFKISFHFIFFKDSLLMKNCSLILNG